MEIRLIETLVKLILFFIIIHPFKWLSLGRFSFVLSIHQPPVLHLLLNDKSGPWKLKSDKYVTQFKFVPWKPIICENQACPTKKEIASRISLNGPQAIGATFGESSVPIYICEACFHDSENNWSPNINLQKPMTTVQLECENRNCNQEENAEVGH